MPWNPDQYHKYQAQRSAPFEDLLALVRVRGGLKVVDLGCGTGELTRRMAEALPASEVLGVDSSPQMLARAHTQARAGLRFEEADQASLGGSYDLIFSSAAMQWTEDHPRLLAHLWGCLAPGGQIAVQVPSNHRHASHQAILEAARQEPFAEALGGWTRRSPVLAIEDYAGLLHDLGAQAIVVFEKVYPHVLADAAAVVEWIGGTALVPYFERLPEELHAPFRQAILDRLQSAWPAGPVFYPFKRTFFSAFKKDNTPHPGF